MTFLIRGSAILVVAAFMAAPVAAADGARSGPQGLGPDGIEATDAMFEFLVAEMAAQRGDVQGALAVQHRLARELRDPQIARRAVELAIRARAHGPALEGAVLLLELEPGSTLAREIMAALLANDGDLAKARGTVGKFLARSPDPAGLLLQLSYVLGKFTDKAAVLEATRGLAGPYSSLPESHYAVGVAALVANQLAVASEEVDKALAARPHWDEAAILKAQVLRKVDASAVLPFYASFIERNPDSLEVRMQLGRELASARKLEEARAHFRHAERLAGKDAQPAYAIGLLSLQLEDHAEAQSAFTRALKLGYRDPAAIYLGLGQAAEGLKQFEEAIGWYQKVESNEWVRAQLKVATILARQQGLEAGRQYLRRIEPRSGDDRIQVIQVEAQLLRDAKAWKDTYEMLTEAVAQYPESYELLYDRAMAAEKIDRLDILEQDLREVIRMKPDYAHAYNALGYTLAEKTDRLAEARELIEKAHDLLPDDPFILDSLGWIHYRLGSVETALRHLQAAYSARPDPEIAAHLGEVLWKVGQRDEAEKIWRAALTENPNHESLTTVMQKYRP